MACGLHSCESLCHAGNYSIRRLMMWDPRTRSCTCGSHVAISQLSRLKQHMSQLARVFASPRFCPNVYIHPSDNQCPSTVRTASVPSTQPLLRVQ
ncbi:uncharacterized protein LACBIDRAFT_300472 [Laccaria bicolor S238N-H82]|uniref:Predicted protein n=1 Tax=Laccaria bicolor (strain S238N-H82 / ATCC MYA-4686) TaxID=486041 RepID=B0DGV1_LACBS|nr:uncharacterized protein LACBIDRAFT_300472 [Laccaria bicolor S238N-H82]EDR06337.1 predicted protein [Laccaria bicolor S238N-H82]|eukprot:XP_001883198.1 predicted protein [Laccaria bicolor S238N-H82]